MTTYTKSTDFLAKDSLPLNNAAKYVKGSEIDTEFNNLATADADNLKISALGTGVETALGVNVGSAGAPVLFDGAGGTPTSLVGTNITGTAAGLTAGAVTTNANLTGHVTSVGNAAVLGSFTHAQLNTAVSDANLAASGANADITSLTGNITAIKFAATQTPSADVKTLDDYEEGTWTPVLTFTTPGDLSVAYSIQTGFYTKIGRLVVAHFDVTCSSFSHATASGSATITGLPFASAAGNQMVTALGMFRGITKVGYTQFGIRATANATTAIIDASGSAVTNSTVAVADMPTGGTPVMRGSIVYFVA